MVQTSIDDGIPNLRAFAGTQLEVVNRRAGWNVAQGHRIADQDVGVRTADNLRSRLQPVGMQDVTLLAVGVREQRDTGRAIGIVLNRNHGRRDPGLVALEVNQAQLALVTAAAEPASHIARIAPSAGPLLRFGQRLVRTIRGQLVVDQRRLEASRLGRRFVCLDRHVCSQLSTTNSVRTPASSRLTSDERMPSSSPDGGRRNVRDGAPCPEN